MDQNTFTLLDKLCDAQKEIITKYAEKGGFWNAWYTMRLLHENQLTMRAIRGEPPDNHFCCC
jgi:hypothetical protein